MWRFEAACREANAEQREWFFGVDGADLEPEAAAEARLESQRMYAMAISTFCAGCAVQLPCLLEGIEAQDFRGVWGGFTGSQRRRKAVVELLSAG